LVDDAHGAAGEADGGGELVGSSAMSATSAVSSATVVPLAPIAIPTSATARAGRR
jgi:hypothetical protein